LWSSFLAVNQLCCLASFADPKPLRKRAHGVMRKVV